MKYNDPKLTDLNQINLRAYGACAQGTSANTPFCNSGGGGNNNSTYGNLNYCTTGTGAPASKNAPLFIGKGCRAGVTATGTAIGDCATGNIVSIDTTKVGQCSTGSAPTGGVVCTTGNAN